MFGGGGGWHFRWREDTSAVFRGSTHIESIVARQFLAGGGQVIVFFRSGAGIVLDSGCSQFILNIRVSLFHSAAGRVCYKGFIIFDMCPSSASFPIDLLLF